MTYLESIPECDELLADRKAAIRLRNLLARHPNPRDPHFPVDLEARADVEYEAFDALLTEVRSLLEKAESHKRAGRDINTRLALSDAVTEINDWLKLW
jgi:hypothetical protein